jgi:hypothetical protein
MMAPGTENTLVPTPGSEQKSLEVAVEAAAEFIAAAKADNTAGPMRRTGGISRSGARRTG